MREREGLFGTHAPPAQRIGGNSTSTCEATRLRRKLAKKHRIAYSKSLKNQQKKVGMSLNFIARHTPSHCFGMQLWEAGVETEKKQLKLRHEKKQAEVRAQQQAILMLNSSNLTGENQI